MRSIPALGLSIALFLSASLPVSAAHPVIEGKSLLDSAPVQIHVKDATATVVAFVSARCPCSMSHEPVLKELAREFKEARFVAIHSNADESEVESAAHFRQTAFSFPVVQDSGSSLANEFGALKTPHVFVLDKSGEIVFQGGVDDSHDAGRATKPYLKNALLAIRAGKTPEIRQARSLGCVIRR